MTEYIIHSFNQTNTGLTNSESGVVLSRFEKKDIKKSIILKTDSIAIGLNRLSRLVALKSGLIQWLLAYSQTIFNKHKL